MNLKLIQGIVDHLLMHLPLRVAGIDHMENDICIGGLFKCGVECVNQLMRKLMDESNGICKENLLSIIQLTASRGWVQCSK